MKYFSHLRDAQKKTIINNLRILKNGLSLEKRKNSLYRLKKYGKSAEKKEIDFIIKKLKFQKIIRDEKRKIYIPLNLDDIIKNNGLR